MADGGWNLARVGSKVRLHLRKTGGEGVGVRAGVRSWVGEDVGTRQQCQCETKARNRVGSGDKGRGLGRVRTLKQDSLKANGLGSRRRLLAHRPFASRPRLPARPRLLTHQGERGPGQGCPSPRQPPKLYCSIQAKDNRESARPVGFRPRPRSAEPIAEPKGALGRGQRSRLPQAPSAGAGARSWEAGDTVG